MKRINQRNSKNKNPPRMSVSETRDPFQRLRHHWCTKKEDRRREAIGFKIPVTRGHLIVEKKHRWRRVSQKKTTTRPCPVKHILWIFVNPRKKSYFTVEKGLVISEIFVLDWIWRKNINRNKQQNKQNTTKNKFSNFRKIYKFLQTPVYSTLMTFPISRSSMLEMPEGYKVDNDLLFWIQCDHALN